MKDRSRQKSPLHEASTTPEKSKHESIIDWQMAASSTPLPVVESDSFKPEEYGEAMPREPTPQPASRPKSSFDLARKWELNEGDSVQSLQQSTTPKVRVRGAAIDAIREREIQSLARSALTTNRLGELKEQRSLDRIGKRSASQAVRDAGGEQDSEAPAPREEPAAVEQTQNTSEDENGKKPQIHVEALLEDSNGTPIPESPVVVFKDRPQSPESADSQRSDFHSRRSRARPGDTRDVLRKLARMTSQSPEPARVDTHFKHESVSTDQLDKPADGPFSKQPEPKASDLERNASDSKDQVETLRQIDSTPLPPKPAAYLKTPLVTGAWIETPIPKSTRQTAREDDAVDPIAVQKSQEVVDNALFDLGMGNLAKRPSIIQEPTEPHIPLEETAPRLPKSALAAIIERAKSHKGRQPNADNSETLQLDDSTIASLEDLLASSNDEAPASSPPTPSESHNLPTPPPSTTHKASSPKRNHPKKDIETEVQSYARLASRLTHLRSSISEAKQDVGSLQKRLRKPDASSSSRAPPTRSQSQPAKPVAAAASAAAFDEFAEPAAGQCDQAGEFHDFIWPCERCESARTRAGMSADWDWQPILVPRLWRWRASGDGWSLPRPTKFALGLVVAAALLATELILW